jgi:hypothetical protein
VTSKMTKASNPVSRAFCRASKVVIGESCLVPSERFPTVRWSSGIMAVSLREFSFVPHERHYAYVWAYSIWKKRCLAWGSRWGVPSEEYSKARPGTQWGQGEGELIEGSKWQAW